MNPLDLLPPQLRLALSWAAVIMPLLLVALHAFRHAADAFYEHALTTPETWDDKPTLRLRSAVRWLDGWVTAIARYVPGPPKASEVAPPISEREGPA